MLYKVLFMPVWLETWTSYLEFLFSLFTEFSICLLRLKDSSSYESTLEPEHEVEDHTSVEGP